MKKIYLLALIALMSIGAITAQTFNWEEQVVTERSENLQNMAVSEDGSATIVGYGNIFVKSTDGGETWNNTGVFETDDFDYQDISFSGDVGFAVAMTGYKVIDHPAGSSNDLFANSPLLKTTDGGNTWEIITVANMGDGTDNTLHPSAIGNYSVKFTSVEVIDANTVYVGVYWKDVDGGTHQNVLKSIDAGTSWTALLPDNGSKSIASIDVFANHIYVSGSKTLLRISLTDDSVVDLHTIVDPEEDDNMFFWGISSLGNAIIFTSTSDSIWESTDEGSSFTALPNVSGGNFTYKHNDSTYIVGGSTSKTKATTDGGKTWEAISAGESLWNYTILGDSLVALAKNEVYTLALSDISNGIFTWNSKTITETSGNLKGIATSDNLTFITGYSNIFLVSDDGGQSFQEVNIPSESDIIYASLDMDLRGLSAGKGAAAIASTRRIKLADFPSDGPEDKYRPGLLLYTTDNWSTFDVMDDSKVGAKYDKSSLNPYQEGCFGQDYYTVECVDDTTFYTFVQWYDSLGLESKATYGRVFKTCDAGENWDTITSDLGNLFMTTIVADGDDLFIGGSKTLLKSEDAGTTVTNIASKMEDLGASDPYIQGVEKQGDTLYIPTTSDFVFVSYDNGETLSKINGLVGASVIAPIDGDSWMSLGSSTKTKYTNDGGTNWEVCYPGSTSYAGTIYNDQIIAICKSKIYKLDIADLDADAASKIENSIAQADIKVWQSNETLHITSESLMSNCHIYSISGKCVFTATNSSNSITVNTNEYIHGIYLVSVKTEKSTLIHKVVFK